MATFGERLRELRKEQKLTLEALAKEVGSQKETISRYENGKREPSNTVLFELAEFFETPITYLIGLTDDRHFKQLTDEETAEIVEAGEQEMLNAMVEKYKDLSPDMQQFVRVTVLNAYKSERMLGKLQSQEV